MVVKKDGTREAYDRDKVKSGILRACEKRPVSAEDVEKALNNVEKAILDTDEVASTKVGDKVMRELKKLDKVAYIRFASVYREFDDISSFEKEVKLLKQ